MSKIRSQTSVLVIGLAMAGVSQAAMFENSCRPGHVTVPCEASAWDIGVEAMLLEATSGNNWDYAEYYGTAPGIESLFERRSFQPNHEFGWRVEGSYHFNTGNDATLIWTHFKEDSKVTGQSYQSDQYNDESQYFFNLYFDEINARTDVRLDSLDLEFGQLAHYGHRYHVRTHYGFQWARIENGIEADVTLDESDLYLTSPTASYTNDSEFRGIGIRAGLDTGYELGNGFSLEGDAALAVLAGTLKSRTQLFTPGFETEGPNVPPITNVWISKRRAIVPELDAVAAVRYTRQLSNSEISVSLGWRIINYFDAIETTLETISANAADDTGYQGAGNPTSVRLQLNNFALSGPVAGIRWVG